MGKYGMFDSEAERDAWVAQRDREIAQEALELSGIGIQSPADLVGKYAALCDLFERFAYRILSGEADFELTPGPDDILHTSDGARAAANRVLEIMQGQS